MRCVCVCVYLPSKESGGTVWWNDNVNFKLCTRCRLFTKFLVNIYLSTPNITIYVLVQSFIVTHIWVSERAYVCAYLYVPENWSDFNGKVPKIVFLLFDHIDQKNQSLTVNHDIKIQMIFLIFIQFCITLNCFFIFVGKSYWMIIIWLASDFMRICLHLCAKTMMRIEIKSQFYWKQIDDLFFWLLPHNSIFTMISTMRSMQCTLNGNDSLKAKNLIGKCNLVCTNVNWKRNCLLE